MYITFRDTKPFEDQPLSLPVSTIVSLIFLFFFFFTAARMASQGEARRSGGQTWQRHGRVGRTTDIEGVPLEGSVWAMPEDQKLLPTGRLDGTTRSREPSTRHVTQHC